MCCGVLCCWIGVYRSTVHRVHGVARGGLGKALVAPDQRQTHVPRARIALLHS